MKFRSSRADQTEQEQRDLLHIQNYISASFQPTISSVEMKIRLRHPNGQDTLTLSDRSTVGDLEDHIIAKAGFPSFGLKHGYPPKDLSLQDFHKASTLSSVGIKLDGEQLIVSKKSSQASDKTTNTELRDGPVSALPSSPAERAMTSSDAKTPSSFSFLDVGQAPPNPASKSASLQAFPRPSKSADQDAPEYPLSDHSATILLRIMPDDNSCLFRAFNTAFFGAMDNMHELRSIVAQDIQADPATYSAAVLDQNPDDYCRWIQTEDAWGGAIELDILSKHFDIEICSIDVQTLRIDRYNEHSPNRCILVYSGIHYDTIAISPSDPPHTHSNSPPDFDTKIFPSVDESILTAAVGICRTLQAKHYYTDTARFSVCCNDCGVHLTGEKGATEHAMKTGHMNFGEAV